MTASAAAASKAVDALKRRHPEWQPWLSVIEAVLLETANPRWDELVPRDAPAPNGATPLAAGTSIDSTSPLIADWIGRLLRAAYRSGAPGMAALQSIERREIDHAAVFSAALCQNGARLREMARTLTTQEDGFSALAMLLPVPLLHACNRAWRSFRSPGWAKGYCPVCGSWPTFAEVRGIERDHFFRCGRCNGDWQAHRLFCPFCGNTDHRQLISLMPESPGAARAVDVCKICLGYVKSFTTLQAAAAVMIDDLASVDLDIAALEHGYKRPEGPGYRFEVTAVAATL